MTLRAPCSFKKLRIYFLTGKKVWYEEKENTNTINK